MEKSWRQSCCPAAASLPQLPCWLLRAQPLGVIRHLQLGWSWHLRPSTPWPHGLHCPAENTGPSPFPAPRGSPDRGLWAPCRGPEEAVGQGPAARVAGLSWQRPRGVRRSHCLCRAPCAEEALPDFLPTHPAVRGARRQPWLTPCGPGSLRESLRASGTARGPSCPSTRWLLRDSAHAAPRGATWPRGSVGSGAPPGACVPRLGRDGHVRTCLPPPPLRPSDPQRRQRSLPRDPQPRPQRAFPLAARVSGRGRGGTGPNRLCPRGQERREGS